MAESEKPKDGPPESPTTARELDWDDDDVPSSPKLSKPTSDAPRDGSTANPSEQPPAPPPRPVNPREQAEATLREAFPSIDASVVKAVLVASGWQVEPAFNALLGMSDPDAQVEPLPPPQPPRPAEPPRSPAAQHQVDQDELYARQLAEHYNTQTYDPRRDSSRDYRGQENPRLPRRPQETGLNPNELYDDRERSFIDDDLPEIRENIRKGFLETQSKVTNFISNLRKKFDEDSDEEHPPPPPPRKGQQFGGTGQDHSRRSADRDRYDADPQVLGDDFTGLKLEDHTTPQRQSNRPLANPDLFKPTPTQPGSGRKVSFQDGSRDDNDLYDVSPDPTKRPSSTGSKSKWQPMAAVDPDPVQEHDPFSLGDSEDEDTKKKDIKPEDTERLKQATAEAMADSIGTAPKDGPKPADIEGTKDKEAEEKLIGKA